jgi:hypothetical protein
VSSTESVDATGVLLEEVELCEETAELDEEDETVEEELVVEECVVELLVVA